MQVTLIINQHLPPRFVETFRSTAAQLLRSFALEDEGTAHILCIHRPQSEKQ